MLSPHGLSAPGTSELRVDLVDFEGNHQFAKYGSFRVAGEAEKYKLVLGAFVGGSAGECPPWAEGPGRRSRGELLPVPAPPLPRGEWRPDVFSVRTRRRKCYPCLMAATESMGHIPYKVQEDVVFTAIIDKDGDRVAM